MREECYRPPRSSQYLQGCHIDEVVRYNLQISCKQLRRRTGKRQARHTENHYENRHADGNAKVDNHIAPFLRTSSAFQVAMKYRRTGRTSG